jgi:CelD/BcsL family acetyltransferase involved in cellulose biosynthesis
MMDVSRLRWSELGPDLLDRYGRDRIFTSTGWAFLWRQAGGTPVVWVVGDGGDPLAILPGVEFGRSRAARFFSMPDGCYGGILPREDLGELPPDLRHLLLEAVADHGYLRAWIFDYYESVDGDLSRWEGFSQGTTLVDISDPRWEPPDRKLVSQIKKAEREGISIREFDWPRDHEKFLSLMRTTERRHGRRPRLAAEFYESLAALSRSEDRVFWKWCEWQGKPACSHIYVVENRVLQGWRIDFDKDFSFLKPNQYIRFHTCREMSRRGIRKLNLGGSPENAPGLRYYKRRWGGETVRYRGLRCESRWGRWLSRWKPPRA